MAVYVDPLVNNLWKLGPNCHLFADTVEELHSFAQYIGLKRDWFSKPPKWPHYDLTGFKRRKAVNLGAVELNRKEAMEKWRELGFSKRQNTSQATK